MRWTSRMPRQFEILTISGKGQSLVWQPSPQTCWQGHGKKLYYRFYVYRTTREAHIEFYCIVNKTWQYTFTNPYRILTLLEIPEFFVDIFNTKVQETFTILSILTGIDGVNSWIKNVSLTIKVHGLHSIFSVNILVRSVCPAKTAVWSWALLQLLNILIKYGVRQN